MNFTFPIVSPKYGRFIVTAPERFRREIERYWWQIKRNPCGAIGHEFYVRTTIRRHGEPKRTLYLHTYIWSLMGRPPVKRIDHADRSPLNNAEENLRDGSHANARNVGRTRRNTTWLIGVNRHSDGKKWQAQIRCDGKKYYLGLFDDAEEAARVRDAKARELHGEFAVLNYPVAKPAPGADGGKEGEHG